MTDRTCTATVRNAGKTNVHTATDWYGRVVGTRRSTHVYRYAIARRVGVDDDGRATIVIDRWSNSAKTKAGTRHFAIRVEDA